MHKVLITCKVYPFTTKTVVNLANKFVAPSASYKIYPGWGSLVLYYFPSSDIQNDPW